MTYVTATEFSDLLKTEPLADVLATHVLGGTPFAFKDHPEYESLLRNHLKDELGIDASAMRIVGSGRTGFSLNPNNFPRQFSEGSDLDVIVIDSSLFDKYWSTMLKWNYPRRLALPKEEKVWRNQRQNDLYWGWFTPDQIRYDGLSFPDALKPLRDLSANWFNAFRSTGLIPEFAGRSVSGRLYRTWGHVVLYHYDGLRQLKAIVES